MIRQIRDVGQLGVEIGTAYLRYRWTCWRILVGAFALHCLGG